MTATAAEVKDHDDAVPKWKRRRAVREAKAEPAAGGWKRRESDSVVEKRKADDETWTGDVMTSAHRESGLLARGRVGGRRRMGRDEEEVDCTRHEQRMSARRRFSLEEKSANNVRINDSIDALCLEKPPFSLWYYSCSMKFSLLEGRFAHVRPACPSFHLGRRATLLRQRRQIQARYNCLSVS